MEEENEKLTWTFYLYHTEKSNEAMEAFQSFAEKWKDQFAIDNTQATFTGNVDEFVGFINATTDLSVMVRMIKK